MIFENNLWIGNKVVPERICDEIISFFKSKKTQQALVGRVSEEVADLKTRDSGIIFDESPWLYNLLSPFVKKANTVNEWNFDIEGSEPCQFTEYKKNQYYHWHTDSWDSPYKNPSYKHYKKIRKLSITLSLSHENEYKGGDLKVAIPQVKNHELSYNLFKYKTLREKGSFIIFPSYFLHAVEPVTKGTRYSLVNWFVGEPFK